MTKSHVGAAVGVWLVQLVLSGVFFLHMFLSQLSVASCTDTSCDYVLYGAITRTFNTVLAALLFVSAVAIVAMRKRGRWVIAAPVVGIVAATTLLFIAYPLSRAALELPLFGSRV